MSPTEQSETDLITMFTYKKAERKPDLTHKYKKAWLLFPP